MSGSSRVGAGIRARHRSGCIMSGRGSDRGGVSAGHWCRRSVPGRCRWSSTLVTRRCTRRRTVAGSRARR
jgi:hypothetical protein